MALLYIDGFDHYAAANLAQKGWATIIWVNYPQAPSIGTGRFGNGLVCSQNGDFSSSIGRYIPASGTLIFGSWLKFTDATSRSNFLAFVDGVTVQVSVKMTAGNLLSVYRGATLLGTGTYVVVNSVPFYFEFKAKISNSVGTIETRVNGNTDLILTGQNTQATGNSTANVLSLGLMQNNTGGTQTITYDDLYLCDETGSANNNFLGDCRVECLLPIGAGSEAQWTPLSGANYANVDEVVPDDDTTYNKSNTVGGVDTYVMADLVSATGLIYGVQYLEFARKDNAGSRFIAPVARIGGTDYAGSAVGLGDSYVFTREIKELSPATAAAWTLSEINAMEYGVKVTG